jgi:excisionase family DNA binding protein
MAMKKIEIKQKQLKVSEVATLLGVSKPTVRKMVKQGRFPGAYKLEGTSIVRIPESDIERIKTNV